MVSFRKFLVRLTLETFPRGKTIGFSGWAQSQRFAFGRRADHSIPLSDHCDFNELVSLVQQSGAEKIYTIHGFVDEFASHLKKIGFDAQPLREDSLDDFV